MNETRTIFVYLAFSFIAAIFLILLVITSRTHTASLALSEKIGIATIFILSCSAGISFTFKPNWVRYHFSQSTNQEKNTKPQVKRSFQGHHPECPIFQNHTILWRQKTWCAGCLGLFIGLCVSIVLMILYMITDFQLTKMMFLLILLIGCLILIAVHVEILHRSKHVAVHVFINSLMPLSFFIIIVSVGGITGEFIYGLFSILLCFLWLDTRIKLSKSRHRVLCRTCVESCKMFTESG